MADVGKTYASWVRDYETTDLNSLADGSNVLGAEIDNSANDYPYIKVSVTINDLDLSAQTNPGVYIWIVETDDVGYEEADASTDPARGPDIILPAVVQDSTAILIGYGYVPETFKIMIGNRCGAAFEASGNTLDYQLFTQAIA